VRATAAWRLGQRDSTSGSFRLKMRMSPIWAAVEMKSNSVGLTVVVRPSRTAVSAAGRTGHSSSRPSTTFFATARCAAVDSGPDVLAGNVAVETFGEFLG
jgi:hypothetical protein